MKLKFYSLAFLAIGAMFASTESVTPQIEVQQNELPADWESVPTARAEERRLFSDTHPFYQAMQTTGDLVVYLEGRVGKQTEDLESFGNRLSKLESVIRSIDAGIDQRVNALQRVVDDLRMELVQLKTAPIIVTTAQTAPLSQAQEPITRTLNGGPTPTFDGRPEARNKAGRQPSPAMSETDTYAPSASGQQDTASSERMGGHTHSRPGSMSVPFPHNHQGNVHFIPWLPVWQGPHNEFGQQQFGQQSVRTSRERRDSGAIPPGHQLPQAPDGSLTHRGSLLPPRNHLQPPRSHSTSNLGNPFPPGPPMPHFMHPPARSNSSGNLTTSPNGSPTNVGFILPSLPGTRFYPHSLV